jgi:hypothetical protein
MSLRKKGSPIETLRRRLGCDFFELIAKLAA